MDSVAPKVAVCTLLAAAAALPLSLLWDYSWESTVGLDYWWAAPHVAGYVAIVLAMAVACGMMRRGEGVAVHGMRAPLGAWVILWGGLAFLTAFLFERWWATAYGLGAGIWHPPQILKAVAFFALLLGIWVWCAPRAGGLAFAMSGGMVLAMIGVVTLASNFANRQHHAVFFILSAATYPMVLAALAAAGRGRFPATLGALMYTFLLAAAVWVLPLVPGQPQTAPIFHPRDHLLPPPFPLLLVLPALAMDGFLRLMRAPGDHRSGWGTAVEAGLAFALVFLAAQWFFAAFLLSPAADNRLFAGGGRHWPFFLQIDPSAEQAFWATPEETLSLGRALLACGAAILATRAGLWLGRWMEAVRR